MVNGEIIAFWNYILEADSEFGDTNLVLLMNVGVSNLVIVNVKIQRQVLVTVSVGDSLMLVLVI